MHSAEQPPEAVRELARLMDQVRRALSLAGERMPLAFWSKLSAAYYTSALIIADALRDLPAVPSVLDDAEGDKVPSEVAGKIDNLGRDRGFAPQLVLLMHRYAEMVAAARAFESAMASAEPLPPGASGLLLAVKSLLDPDRKEGERHG